MQRPLGRAVAWPTVCGAAFATWSFLVLRIPRYPTDFDQQAPALHALAEGRLDQVYAAHNLLTSPPGFLLLAVPLVALGGDHVLRHVMLPLLAVPSEGLLLLASLRFRRVIWPGPFGLRDVAATVVLLCAAPFTSGLLVYFHPEDIVATGLLLLALAEAVQQNAGRAGLLLGAAILTRQWAILAIAPFLLYLPGGRRRFVEATFLLCAAGLLPFAVLSPAGLVRALQARIVITSGLSIWRYIAVGPAERYAVARLAPLVCVPLLALVVGRTWRKRRPSPEALAAACMAFLALRAVFDTDTLQYYLAPSAALLVLISVRWDDRRLRRILQAAAVLLMASIQEQVLLFKDVGRASVVELELVYVALVATGMALAVVGVMRSDCPVERAAVEIRRAPGAGAQLAPAP